MKKIGLIGGITWHSTLEYYREINTETQRRRGGMRNAGLVLESLDFEEIATLGAQGREDEVYARFLAAARSLTRAGAEILALCANTAHRRADRLQEELDVPLVHMGEAVGRAVRAAGLSRVGLLGTVRTMTEPFLLQRLAQKHGLDVLTPEASVRAELDHQIHAEMAQGVFSQEARETVQRACEEFVARGAQGVVLACTELPILMRNVSLTFPAFDTTRLHAVSIVDAALS